MVVIDVVDASIIFSSRAFFYLFCVKKNEKKSHKLTKIKLSKSLFVFFFCVSSLTKHKEKREREREKKNHHGCARVVDRLSDRDGERKRREREREIGAFFRAQEQKKKKNTHSLCIKFCFTEYSSRRGRLCVSVCDFLFVLAKKKHVYIIKRRDGVIRRQQEQRRRQCAEREQASAQSKVFSIHDQHGDWEINV